MTAIPALTSRITSVTVFDTHALVTRTAELERGTASIPGVVRLSGLPLALDDSSVRVRVEPATEVSGAVVNRAGIPEAADARVGLEVPELDPDLAPPRDEELLDARATVRQIEDELRYNQELSSRLLQLSAPPRPNGADGEPPPPAPAAARLALLELRQGELEGLAEAHLGLQRRHLEARRQLQQLEDRFRRATSARQARKHELRKSIIVQLRGAEVPPAGCRLVAEYLVPGVCWAPCYSIRFSPGYGSAELAVRAQICQATGEDWQNVTLVLSTAVPQRWTELPELHSLRIGRHQPVLPATGWREPPIGADSLLADYDRALAAAPPRPAAMPSVAAEALVDAVSESTGALAEPEDQRMAAELEADLEIEQCLAEEPMFAGLAAPVPAAAALAASAPPPARHRVKAKMAKRARPPEGRADDAKPAEADRAEPAELAAPADLLRYGALRLAGPGEPQRGSLRPVGERELSLELLANLRIEVSFDVQLVVRMAQQQASAIGHKQPPPGHDSPGLWQGFAHAYTAEQPVSLPSDGSFHNLPLLQRQAATELRFVTVPRESLEVFRFVSFRNPLPAPMPRGPADIYLGADYLVSSQVHTVAPGGLAELGLGVEQAIKVARNTSFQEQTSGMLGGTLNLEHGIDIEVANHLDEPAAIEVRERLPISREGDEEITVELTKVEPPWRDFEQQRRAIDGAYCWRLTTPPGKKEQLKLCYRVSLAAKQELIGGNRREQ